MLWGKLLNAGMYCYLYYIYLNHKNFQFYFLGQTCVAPDYVLCSKETQVDFFKYL